MRKKISASRNGDFRRGIVYSGNFGRDADTISAIIADEMALGVINGKTTAVRLIPVPGKEAGDHVSFGGLFGASPIMPIRNVGMSSRFIAWGGRMPAPVHSFKN